MSDPIPFPNERPREDSPRTGGPEHVSSILLRVLERITTMIDANAGSGPTEPPPPPAQRPAA